MGSGFRSAAAPAVASRPFPDAVEVLSTGDRALCAVECEAAPPKIGSNRAWRFAQGNCGCPAQSLSGHDHHLHESGSATTCCRGGALAERRWPMRKLSQMSRHVEEYLRMRRSFGFQLAISGRQLHQFASFADRVTPGRPLTIEVALS